MTDDLTRGLEGQQDTSADSTEISYTTGREGAATVVGQAAEVVNVSRPAAGQTVEIQAAAGQTYNLDFPPAGAQVQLDGSDFILAFEDGGRIVFSDMATVVEGGDAPTFTLAGTEVGAEVLLTQALALAGQDDATLETAAAPDALGTGATVYVDFLGNLIELLIAQGVIPPVELEFGLIDLEEDPFALTTGALEEQSTPLINEIGIAVKMNIPDLPPEEGGEAAEEAAVAAAEEAKTASEVNFIELMNTDGGAFDVSGMTLEILNPAGDVVTFVMPGGTVLPPNGFVVLYQAAEDPEEDGETVYLRIFDAEGNVVGGVDVAGADFWNLGDDTTDPIAVNLVDGGESLDTFAANLTQDDLAGLTDPSFAGTPADFVSPLLDLNLETFNGQFTDNHHIFSRVNSTDTDSQNDWTTNNIPTDGGLNTTGVPGGPFAYTITGADVLLVIDLSDGTTYEVGPLFDGDGVLSGDFEGLTFGQGADAGFLFAYDDGDDRIVKVDPATGEVVEQWTLDDLVVAGLSNSGLTVASDGTFYVVGDNQGIYEVVFGAGVFSLTEIAPTAEFGDFDITGLAADPNDPNLLYAIGEDSGTVKLFTIAADSGVVTELPGAIGIASSQQMGLAFDADGNLWAIDEQNDLAYQVDPVTGASIPGSTVLLPSGLSLESIAILLDGVPDIVDANPWDPLNDDLNPEQNNPDPLAGQNFLQAADGGDTVEGFGGPDFIQGAAGDDGLYGGSQDLVEQQAQKIAGQLELLEGAGVPVLGEGTQDGLDAELVHQPFFSDHNDFLFGDAGDDQMYGGSGGDYMIGGEGDDSMDGGTGDDEIFGDGSQEIGGLPEEGEGTGEDGAIEYGDDVLAGDALNNLDSLLGGDDVEPEMEAPDGVEAILEGYDGAAAAILGGNDTIDAGKGDDIASGDALATGAESVYALGYADNSFLRPENGVASDGGLVQNDESGNILLVDALGNVQVAVSEADITDLTGLGSAAFEETGIDIDAEGTIYFTEEESGAVYRKTEFGEVELVTSNDAINTALGGGTSPEPKGLVVGLDGFVYITEDDTDSILKIDPADGTVTVLTAAADVEALGGITSFAVEGGLIASADGLSLYVTSEGSPDAIIQIDLATGTPEVLASGAPFDDLDGYMVLAPNGDIIVADEGTDTFYRVTPDGAVSEFLSNAELTAVFGGGVDLEGGFWFDSDGNFYVTNENGDDIAKFESVNPWTGEADPAGQVLLSEADILAAIGSNVDYEGGAVAVPGGGAFPTDTGFANDIIDGGEGDDALAGDSAAIAVADEDSEEATEAKAVAINNAVYSDGVSDGESTAATGNDIIDGGEGDNRIAGEAQAIADDAEAVAQNTAAGEDVEAGNDKIKAHEGDDNISGDAQALGKDTAVSKAFNTVVGIGEEDANRSSAGNDYIVAGEGDNTVAGDSQAISEYGEASAYGENTAGDGGSDDVNRAGNDTIFGSLLGDDVLSGGAQAVAAKDAFAEQQNHAGGEDSADDDNEAGNDLIQGYEGDNVVAGDAQAIAEDHFSFATAKSHNHSEADDIEDGANNAAGDDRIHTGDDDDKAAGDAQAIAGKLADAWSTNKALGYGNTAGNDDIDAGHGKNKVAGDAQAIAGLKAWAYGTNTAGDGDADRDNTAGNDTIVSGGASDTVSGGAQAMAGLFAHADQVNQAGASGDGERDNSAGNDDIDVAGGKNRAAGDAQAISTFGVAEAYSANAAGAEGSFGGNAAGNDVIESGNGRDTVSGDAQAIAKLHALSVSSNVVGGDEDNRAGNDFIDAGHGHNVIAGDSQAIASHGVAEAYGENTAADENDNDAGNDTIRSGNDEDTISGGAMAVAAALAFARQVNAAEQGNAGNDDIDSDVGGNDEDEVAGDAMARSQGWGFSDAVAESVNIASSSSSSTGLDIIDAGGNDNHVAGEAMAVNTGDDAEATAVNAATDGGRAGNDEIFTGGSSDIVSGGTQARAKDDATADTDNWATGDNSEAGNDVIEAGQGNNQVAGDAQAISDDDAWAYGSNIAGDGNGDSGNQAGDDTITTGDQTDTVSGGAQALANDQAFAEQINRAGAGGDDEVGNYAGNDDIDVGDGFNRVAGDSQAISYNDDAAAYGENEAGNDGSADGNYAGNDTIVAGENSDRISGGAQAIANDAAYASQENDAGTGAFDDDNRAGNDDISVGGGANRVAGDAQALAGGNATALSDNHADSTDVEPDGLADNQAGNDVIEAGNDGDRISGDAQAITDGDATAAATNTALGNGNLAGNDSINAGDGSNLLAGDAHAEAGGDADAQTDNTADGAGNVAGVDTITGGINVDIIAGGSLAIGNTGAANTNNQALNGGVAGDDTIDAGDGDDTVSGDSGSLVVLGGTATTENTAAGGSVQNNSRAGNDKIIAGDGNNVVAGDALETADVNAQAHATNNAAGLKAFAGNDVGLAGTGAGSDDMAGDALVKGELGLAVATNNATGGSSHAGDDSLRGEGGNDEIAGEAAAFGAGAQSESHNTANAGGGWAGNDYINLGSGEDWAAGDAGSFGADSGNATAWNTATVSENANDISKAGDDDIYADGENGRERIAGDALAAGAGATALAMNTAMALVGDVDAYGGNDLIVSDNGGALNDDHGGDGPDEIGGDALATAEDGVATVVNSAEVDGDPHSDAFAGNDTIDADGDRNVIAGDAASTADDGGNATATNMAAAAGEIDGEFINEAQAGNDLIETRTVVSFDDQSDEDDYIAGDALTRGVGTTALAVNQGTGSDYGYAYAGNDTIESGDDGDAVAGEALTTGDDALARAENSGFGEDDATVTVGSDSIEAGVDSDTISGGALATGTGGAAEADNDAEAQDFASVVVGNDTLSGGPDQGDNNGDLMAGDALASGADGEATAENAALASISGSALAGNDDINGKWGWDTISGDAMTGEDGGNATAVNTATVAATDDEDTTGAEAGAGNDTIDSGSTNSSERIAGDALTLNDGAVASVQNTARVEENVDGNSASAGNDFIDSDGVGFHRLAGDAFAEGDGTGADDFYMAEVQNDAFGGFSAAGNDEILAGGQASEVAGDALTTGEDGHALVLNQALEDVDTLGPLGVREAGNDTITSTANGSKVIAGDALATGQNGNAVVHNTIANAAAAAIVGSDLIEGSDDLDLIAGDAMATDSGDAVVINDPVGESGSQAGEDSINGNDGNDTISGDGLSVGGTASVTNGGDDEIDGGDGNDSIAGDGMALDGGTVILIDSAGDDIIDGGDGNDTIYGDSSDPDDAIGGDDILLGGAGDDLIYGGAGDDFINGGFGEDSVYGGAGDDTLVFGSLDAVIDGGDGTDTVLITIDADLTGNTSLNDIEIIDMTDGDDFDDLTLTAADVLNMTDANDLLQILGDPVGGAGTGDQVNLTGGNWNAGVVGVDFTVYTNLNGATVEIDNDIDVTVS